MFGLNRDIEKRDEIIFGKYEPKSYQGGMCRFENLSLEKLKQLVDLNFIRLEERQNDSPSVREFIEFMEKYSGYTVMGYTISGDRRDYCVSLEGIEKDNYVDSGEEISEFINLFGGADDFDTYHGMYAWFD